jgi:uncharacterized membrane protein
MLCPATFGDVWGAIIFGLNVIGGLMVVNIVSRSATLDLDSILLKIPVFGSVYELFLRLNDTYYTEDSRLLYFEIVGAVVAEKVREFAAAQGIEEVEFKVNDDPKSPRSRFDQMRDVIADFSDLPISARRRI